MQNWNGKHSVILASLPTSFERDILSWQDFLQPIPHVVVTRVVAEFLPFYAKDREDAERQAEEILQEHPSYVRLDLKAYPSGFKIVMTHLPGTIEED